MKKNFIAMVPRITTKSGKNHDYVLIYAKNINCVQLSGYKMNTDDYPYKDEFYDERGGYKLNQTLDYSSLKYNPKMDFPLEVNAKTFYPGSNEASHKLRHIGKHNANDWVWRWSKEKFNFGLDNGFVVIKNGFPNCNPRIYTKTYAKATISKKKPYTVEYVEREKAISSLSFLENDFSNDTAKKELREMGLKEFTFPKPTTLIKALIRLVKNANIVLDFFAGSGTTGQAVLELNKEDGGNRTFILCTNNENKICENITYERIKTTISGSYGQNKSSV